MRLFAALLSLVMSVGAAMLFFVPVVFGGGRPNLLAIAGGVAMAVLLIGALVLLHAYVAAGTTAAYIASLRAARATSPARPNAADYARFDMQRWLDSAR